MFGRRKRVTMLASVGGEFVAGRTYRVASPKADELIARGYAKGDLSREYSDEEINALKGTPQVVRLG